MSEPILFISHITIKQGMLRGSSGVPRDVSLIEQNKRGAASCFRAACHSSRLGARQ
jgi:hypothetical protein